MYILLYYLIIQFLPHSTIPVLGTFCKRIRGFFCSKIFLSSGCNIDIGRKAYFGNGKHIKIGNNSGLGENFRMQNAELSIGNYVLMGPDVLILGGGHVHERIDVPIGLQGNLERSVLEISDDVWIGAKVIILGNTKRIGKGAIIGAGAVVTKPVPDFAVVAGNPAKVLRYRC